MILGDALRAWSQLGDPRLQGVLWRGVGAALVLLVVASAVLVWLAQWLVPEVVTLPFVGPVLWLDALAGWAAVPVALVASVVLMVPVASAVTALLLDDVAEAVEARSYGGLPPARPMPWGEAVTDALGAFGLALGVNAVALLLYLALPPLAPVTFVLVNGWLLGRESFKVAALRREGRADALALLRRNSGAAWALGCLVAVPLLVPVLNLVVPTLGAAAFTHLYHRAAREARGR